MIITCIVLSIAAKISGKEFNRRDLNKALAIHGLSCGYLAYLAGLIMVVSYGLCINLMAL